MPWARVSAGPGKEDGTACLDGVEIGPALEGVEGDGTGLVQVFPAAGPVRLEKEQGGRRAHRTPWALAPTEPATRALADFSGAMISHCRDGRGSQRIRELGTWCVAAASDAGRAVTVDGEDRHDVVTDCL